MEAVDGAPIASSSRLTLDVVPPVVASAPAPSRGKKRAKIVDQEESVVPKKKQKLATEGVKVKASRGRNHTRPRPPPQAVHVEPIVPVLKPRWTLLQASTVSASVANPGESNGINTSETLERRPRIWTSCRDEFLATLPELSNAKFVHDVSWHLHETPMIILDHASPSFSVLKTPDMDLISLDIISHRQFSCDDPTYIPTSISTATSTKRGRGGKRRQASRLISGTLPIFSQPPIELKPFEGTTMSPPTGSVHDPPAEPQPTPMMVEPATHTIDAAQPEGLHNSTKTLPSISVVVADSTPIAQTVAENLTQATGKRLTRSRRQSTKSKREELDMPLLNSLPANGDSQPPPPTPKKRRGRLPKAKVVPPEDSLVDPQPDAGNLPTAAGSTSAPAPPSNAPLPSTDPFASMIPLDPQPEVPITQDSLPPSAMSPRTPDTTNQLPPTFLFSTFGTNLDGYVPPIPDEVKAVVEAYLYGKPVAVYATNGCARLHWAPLLPEEFGCMLMGWFRVVGVQEERVPFPDGTLTKIEGGSINGCVSWRFRLRWAPGGEEHFLKKTSLRALERPWWIPLPPSAADPSKFVEGLRNEDEEDEDEDERYSSPLSSPPSSSPRSLPSDLPEPPKEGLTFPLPFQSSIQPRPLIFEEVEETFPTTPKYRTERVGNPNYQYRHYHLREMYYSALPAGILGVTPGAAADPDSNSGMGADEGSGDEGFPRGWVCARCGRLCWQGMLRGRKCVSSFCKNEPLVAPRYAVDVVGLREGVQKLPMILPQDRVPSGVQTHQRDDKDHMVTLSYYFNPPLEVIDGVTGKGSYVKHIFTRNWHGLAKEATELLRLIQLEVDLERDWKHQNNLYFTHAVACPGDQLQVGFDPSTSVWKDAPTPINNGKAWMARHARHYAQVEKKELFIDRVDLVAWLKPGNGKGPLTFRAKEKCVVVLCMGFHVGLTLYPHSGIRMASLEEEDLVSQFDGVGLRPEDVDMGEVHESHGGGWIAAVHAESSMDVDMPADPAPPVPLQMDSSADASPPAQGRPKRRVTGKGDRSDEEIYVELVHGDVLVLSGDDFDCHLKREGMSILMVASHDPNTLIPQDPFPFAHLPPIPLEDDAVP